MKKFMTGIMVVIGRRGGEMKTIRAYCMIKYQIDIDSKPSKQ